MKQKQFKDLAEKYDTPKVGSASQKWYPSVTLDTKDFPDLAKAKVGEDCCVAMQIHKIQHSEDEGGAKMRFEMRGMAPMDDDKEEQDEQKKMMANLPKPTLFKSRIAEARSIYEQTATAKNA